MNDIRFDWHNEKAESNLRKHGISFREAETVFNDPHVLIKPDEAHSLDEDRAHGLGFSEKARLLLVVVVERHENHYRIISARKATRRESQDYFSIWS